MMARYATLLESQERGHARQRGRDYLLDRDRFECGCPAISTNTITRYGKDYCRACNGVKFHERQSTPVVAVGKRFGMLVITQVLGGGRVRARCDCGNRTKVWTGNLQKGSTASCGCTQGTHKYTAQPCALAETW